MFARWLGLDGSGNRSTLEFHPIAASATVQWCRVAPQLMSRPRRSGSACGRCRLGSANRVRLSGPTLQRQGWVLCIDGARVASVSAVRMVPGSGKPNVTLPTASVLGCHCDDPGLAGTGKLVLSLGDFGYLNGVQPRAQRDSAIPG